MRFPRKTTDLLMVITLSLIIVIAVAALFTILRFNFHNKQESTPTVKTFEARMNEVQLEKSRLSKQLYDEVRILCWIMTAPDHISQQKAIVETWGRRCQKVLFMVGQMPNNTYHETKIGKRFSFVNLNISDTYDSLWLKTKLAFAYTAEHHLNEFDWFFKVDDDAYVVLENLRLFLRQRNPTTELSYYGCRYKGMGGYNSGGPGYVLSARTLGVLADALTAGKCQAGAEGPEDQQLGKCLLASGVKLGDTIDENGRLRFFPFQPLMVVDRSLLPSKYNWWWAFTAYTMKEGLECCSDSAISFHYISPSLMKTMEYLIYYLPSFSIRELSEVFD